MYSLGHIPRDTKNIYSLSHLQAEKIISNNLTFKLNTKILRLSNVFGLSIYHNSEEALNNLINNFCYQGIYNNSIILLSWIYVLVIFLIFIFLIAFNQFYLKIKINYKKILIDNFFMIILLGLYEYMFFNTIIIKYKNIDSFTLNQYVVNKINIC